MEKEAIAIGQRTFGPKELSEVFVRAIQRESYNTQWQYIVKFLASYAVAGDEVAIMIAGALFKSLPFRAILMMI